MEMTKQAEQAVHLICNIVYYIFATVPKHFYQGVLVLAGIELIFFTVAGMGLWFGFVLETVLITQECLGYC